jgi:hypothetical protein
MAIQLQKQEVSTLDSTRYVCVNIPGKGQGESLGDIYEVLFDLEFLIDMSVIQWDENPAFWEFINGEYPSHLRVVCTSLHNTPEMLEIELKSGYSIWQTSVTTVVELNERIGANKALPN